MIGLVGGMSAASVIKSQHVKTLVAAFWESWRRDDGEAPTASQWFTDRQSQILSFSQASRFISIENSFSLAKVSRAVSSI